jgi:hypothetical protein
MYTGHDPRYGGEPIDPSGGGSDPSAYYAQSPGGRFRGDTQNFLDYLVGVERGTAGANPDYDVPAWAERLPGLYGRFARWHETNARTGGTGNAPDYADPSLYLYSGPGARFGPPGGPLHGLLDQERPQPWDGPELPPDQGPARPNRPRGGGGGGGGGNFQFQSYGGLNHRPSFVDWQPENPIGEPTRYVYGENTRQAPAPAPIGGRPGGSGGGGGRGPGRGAGGPGGGSGRGTPGPAGPARPRGGQPTEDDFFGWLSDMFGGGGPEDKIARGRDFRAGMGGGVDMNLLDKGQPGGWVRDRTLNPNMAGHRTPDTIPQPRAGQGVQEYMDELARLGFDTESIASLIGPSGFGVNRETGQMTGDWGWGTGPVTRGENGYQFANGSGPGAGTGFSLFGPGPGNNRDPQGGFSLFDRRPGAGDGARMQGGGMGGLMDLILGGQNFAR